MSDDDRARIEELAARGFSSGRIAQVLKRHEATVAWYMYSHGLKAPVQTDKPKVYTLRNGRTVHGFSRDEDDFITTLRKDGRTTSEIAALASQKYKTQRSEPTIRTRLKMLGSIDDAHD